mmetsp:Transcript_34280/g.80125  ORF Transcript_34280/g.80125 Transcript_34280/m.80125 type:complete len:211 (+) Transcript_34280:121-753(+)
MPARTLTALLTAEEQQPPCLPSASKNTSMVTEAISRGARFRRARSTSSSDFLSEVMLPRAAGRVTGHSAAASSFLVDTSQELVARPHVPAPLSESQPGHVFEDGLQTPSTVLRRKVPTSLAAEEPPADSTTAGQTILQKSQAKVLAAEAKVAAAVSTTFHWMRTMSGLTQLFNQTALMLTFVSAIFHVVAYKRLTQAKQMKAEAEAEGRL